jgi:hypothetical protein
METRFLHLLLILALFFAIGVIWSKKTKETQFHFTNILVGCAISAPIMFGGYTFYDEAFLIGYLSQISITKTHMRNYLFKSKIFTLFLIYSLIEILIGIQYFWAQSEPYLPKIRWIIFLILISLALAQKRLNINWINYFKFIHLIIILVFLAAYSIHSVYTKTKYGSTAYGQYAQDPSRGMTDAIWANTAYVVVVLFFFQIIACILFMRIKSVKYKVLTTFIIIITGFNYFLSNSRSGYILTAIIIIAIFVDGVITHNYREKFSVICLLAVSVVLPLMLSGYQNISNTISDLTNVFHSPVELDATNIRIEDRSTQYVVAINLLIRGDGENSLPSLHHLMFGYGARTSGLVLANEIMQAEQVSVSFAPAFLIEYGIFGCGIFLLTVFISMKHLISLNKDARMLVLALYLGCFSLAFIVNLYDLVVFYSILMSNVALYSEKGANDHHGSATDKQ